MSTDNLFSPVPQLQSKASSGFNGPSADSRNDFVDAFLEWFENQLDGLDFYSYHLLSFKVKKDQEESRQKMMNERRPFEINGNKFGLPDIHRLAETFWNVYNEEKIKEASENLTAQKQAKTKCAILLNGWIRDLGTITDDNRFHAYNNPLSLLAVFHRKLIGKIQTFRYGVCKLVDACFNEDGKVLDLFFLGGRLEKNKFGGSDLVFYAQGSNVGYSHIQDSMMRVVVSPEDVASANIDERTLIKTLEMDRGGSYNGFVDFRRDAFNTSNVSDYFEDLIIDFSYSKNPDLLLESCMRFYSFGDSANRKRYRLLSSTYGFKYLETFSEKSGKILKEISQQPELVETDGDDTRGSLVKISVDFYNKMKGKIWNLVLNPQNGQKTYFLTDRVYDFPYFVRKCAVERSFPTYKIGLMFEFEKELEFSTKKPEKYFATETQIVEFFDTTINNEGLGHGYILKFEKYGSSNTETECFLALKLRKVEPNQNATKSHIMQAQEAYGKDVENYPKKCFVSNYGNTFLKKKAVRVDSVKELERFECDTKTPDEKRRLKLFNKQAAQKRKDWMISKGVDSVTLKNIENAKRERKVGTSLNAEGRKEANKKGKQKSKNVKRELMKSTKLNAKNCCACYDKNLGRYVVLRVSLLQDHVCVFPITQRVIDAWGLHHPDKLLALLEIPAQIEPEFLMVHIDSLAIDSDKGTFTFDEFDKTIRCDNLDMSRFSDENKTLITKVLGTTLNLTCGFFTENPNLFGVFVVPVKKNVDDSVVCYAGKDDFVNNTHYTMFTHATDQTTAKKKKAVSPKQKIAVDQVTRKAKRKRTDETEGQVNRKEKVTEMKKEQVKVHIVDLNYALKYLHLFKLF